MVSDLTSCADTYIILIASGNYTEQVGSSIIPKSHTAK